MQFLKPAVHKFNFEFQVTTRTIEDTNRELAVMPVSYCGWPILS